MNPDANLKGMRMTWNCVVDQMGTEARLETLQRLEDHCRARARQDGAFYGHIIAWTTPGGSGITGKRLYFIEAEGKWALSPKPCTGARRWDSIAAYLQEWWRPDRAAGNALEMILGPCSCHRR